MAVGGGLWPQRDNHWSLYGWMLVLLMLSMRLQLSLQACLSACPQTVPEGNWNSNLRVEGNPMAREVTLGWTEDTSRNITFYVVQFREVNVQTFNTSSPITGTSYTIDNLTPNTNYEGQVCRANGSVSDPDNCGRCLFCFSTTNAQEPPSRPRDVQITAAGPQIITVTWDEPEIKNGATSLTYTVVCTRVSTGTVDVNSTGVQNTEITFFTLLPNTMYSCSVVAFNNFGGSVPAMAQITTPARNTVPGLLLLVFSGTISYAQLTESSVRLSSQLENLIQLADTSNDPITGLDYHFYRGEIYATTTNRNLSRMRVNLMSSGEDLQLEVLSGFATLLTRPSNVSLGAVAVDWVNNHVFFVERETENSTSRILRLEIDGSGDPYCVGQWTSNPVGHIEVDPVHGYFYWSQNSLGIYRVELNAVQDQTTSCPSGIPQGTLIINDPNIATFTIESSLYHIGDSSCNNINIGLSSTSLNIRRTVTVAEIMGQTVAMASFSEVVFVALDGSQIVGVYNTSVASNCLQAGPVTPEAPGVQMMRAFRSVKQPLPVPPSSPTNVCVQTTSTSATITWSAPQFVTDFFSNSSFQSWTYYINYTELGSSTSVQSANTSSLSLTLTNLRPDSLYEFTVSAAGPGGEVVNPSTFILQTKMEGGDDDLLLLATEVGVVQTSVIGGSAQVIAPMVSDGSSGIAYDAYTGRYYWVIEGGQSSIYCHSPPSNTTVIHRFRDNPFSLKLDWMARRLLWVEDGETLSSPLRIVGASLEPMDDPMVLTEVERIISTAVDSLNGLMFWVSGREIHMQTLNGLVERVCFTASQDPLALTVDVSRQLLFWVSYSNERVIVSQVEYSRSGCGTSPESHTISLSSNPSRPTALAYASGTLFIGTQDSSTLFTIPANLSAISQQQTLAVGTILLSSLSPTPQGIRDIAVASAELQPLPDGLTSPTQSALIPQPVGSAPRLGSMSTTSRIVVEWDPAPPLPFSSPIVYRLEYSLVHMDGSRTPTQMATSEVPSVSLDISSSYAEVTASVTSYSLWSTSNVTMQAVFRSPPELPIQVQNVQVFVYFPMLSGGSVSALVTWDALTAMEGGGFVQNYTVQVFQNGQLLPPYFRQIGDKMVCFQLHQNPDNRTTYTVQQRVVNSFGLNNSVRYPLVENMEYVVRVFASNPTGDGPPSANVTFNTNMVSPPQQVVAVGASESQLVQPGSMPSPLFSVREPLTVDTTGKQLYWYNGSMIQQQSLDGGDPQPINVGEVDVRALAYNWLGQTLYFAGRVERGGVGRVGVWVYHTINDRVEEVFVGDSLLMGEGLRLAVDPFRGYLYWTIANDSSNSLHQLNLQNTTMSSPLTAPSSPMSKRQATPTLSSLSLTPALALSPRTGRLWVCDADSGNILSCPVVGSCTVEVEAAALGRNDIGLPATSLALDELRVYWTNDTSGIFAVAFSDNTTVIEISPTTTASSSVVSLSPGQQPLPSQDCLSPHLDIIPERPLAELVSRTNTSITVSWTAPTLDPSCTNVFFPPLMYMVRVRLQMEVVDGFPQPSMSTQFRAEGLSPYLDYEFNIRAANEFTEFRFGGTSGFGGPSRIRTLEGVPDPPRNVSALEYGTQNINVRWAPPEIQFDGIGNTLRGPPENLSYYVRVGEQEIATNETEVNLTRADGLLPGTLYTIEVLISNGALNSSATEVSSTTWPLPPTPVVTGYTNTSFSVTVPLNQMHFPALCEINIEYCQNTSCDCTSFKRTTTSQTVPVPPRNLTFQIRGLERFTDYCLRATANYTVLPGFTTVREMLAGSGVVRRTGAGVPDAPMVMLDGDTLSWEAPNDRGSPITRYRITATSDGVPSAETFNADRVVTINLRTAPNFLNTSGVTYSIRVFAENDIGEGLGSEPIDYTYTAITSSPPTGLPTQTIIGIVAAAVAVLVLLIICVFAFVWCMTVHHRHKEVDIRSINYQYGYSHDHELSNLRGLRRHQQASNPHYTWSRDDYICTDEQLDQLNKFPRQNLKLETFIDRGEFGEVYQGTAIDILGNDTGPTPVAVKTLRKGSTPEEQAKFLSEAALMGNFNHENIVKVLGVCVDNDPVFIIMELMLAGDLLKFLRDAKREHGPSLLTLTEQVHVALDVAKGCRYLEQQHFIHRDIAARNCLVSSKGADRVVKIGDFGLAKDLYSSDYYQVEGQRKLPVRWMAPEALLQGKFTIEADIWSFGVLLWEIMTLGNQPYPGRTNQEVLQFVTGGGRLDRPDKCPGRLYHLMQNCWKRYSSERPHFQQIVTVLTNFQEHLNNKRESAYYESDSDDGADFGRQGSAKMPSRTPSIRSGILNLARSSSMKLRNSLRRHGSLHRRDEHSVHNHHQFSVSSSENLIASQDGAFRERGPF